MHVTAMRIGNRCIIRPWGRTAVQRGGLRANLRYPFPRDFARRLEGQRVRAVTRRARYLLVELASGDVLLSHLGMSGSFRVLRSGRTPARRPRDVDLHHSDPHDHVELDMSSGAVIVFNDPRRFGFMTVVTRDEIATRALSRLGPEPLTRQFDAKRLAAGLRRRRATLKVALADQRVVAGLGNIYVSEALHLARLSPKRRASTLVTRAGAPRRAAHELVDAIRQVLRAAIAGQYRAGDGSPFLVYGRDGERCARRGCVGTIPPIVQGGRSTFYCPMCQR